MDEFKPDAHKTTEAKIPHGGGRPDRELGDLDESQVPGLLDKFSGFNTVPDVLVGRTQIEDAADTLARTNDSEPTDTIKTTEPAEKPESTGMSRGKKFGIAIVGGLAAVGIAVPTILGLTSNSGDTDKGTAPEKNDKDNSQVEPGANGEEKPPVVEEEPATPESPLEQAFNLPKPEKFESLDSMSLEEFNQQPIEDRVAYGMWLNRDSKLLAEEWFEASENPRDQLPITTVVGPENTGEEIEANIRALQRGAISHHFTELGFEKAPLYPSLQREKVINSSFLYTNGPGAENWREGARNDNVNGLTPEIYVQNKLMLADEEVISRSETYTHTDQAGVERPAVDTVIREPNGTEVKSTSILVQTPYGSQWVVEKGI